MRYKIEINQDGQQNPLSVKEIELDTEVEAKELAHTMLAEAEPVTSRPYSSKICYWEHGSWVCL